MEKRTHSDRHIDCGCYGYESCEQMATAIYNGFNYKENCIYYNKRLVEFEKNKALQLAEDINYEKQIISNHQEELIFTIESGKRKGKSSRIGDHVLMDCLKNRVRYIIQKAK